MFIKVKCLRGFYGIIYYYDKFLFFFKSYENCCIILLGIKLFILGLWFIVRFYFYSIFLFIFC